MTSQNELRLLVKIATLYYSEGVKQADIARELSLSQSQVSRALSRCVKEGLVKISVVQPPNIFVNIESEIQKRFNLSQAIVVDVPDSPSQEQIRSAIGSAAAHYMQNTLQKGELIGVSSWSETIRSMVDRMHPLASKARGVVQILGGVGQNGNLQATMITHSLAQLLSCDSYLLPATGVGHTVADRERLMSTGEVSKVVDQFDHIDVALVGIGSMEPSMLLRNSGNFYQDEMTSELVKRGAVGDICLHYYTAEGQPVLSDDEDPIISMNLKQLKNCPRVVGLAGGSEKISAIIGALAGGYIDVLIIDRVTALALLSKPL